MGMSPSAQHHVSAVLLIAAGQQVMLVAAAEISRSE
jgi:hypothetical protein